VWVLCLYCVGVCVCNCGFCVCHCGGFCLLLCRGCVYYYIGIVFVIVWRLCLLLCGSCVCY